MKKVTCFLLVTVVLCSCVPGWEDPDVSATVLQFEKDYGVTVDYPVMVVGELEGKHAVCRRRPAGRIVLIDSEIVELFRFYREEHDENSSYYDMQYLLTPMVYHELAHCSFNLDHDSTMITSDIPQTFMNPKFHPTDTWNIFGYDYYKKELAWRAGVKYND